MCWRFVSVVVSFAFFYQSFCMFFFLPSFPSPFLPAASIIFQSHFHFCVVSPFQAFFMHVSSMQSCYWIINVMLFELSSNIIQVSCCMSFIVFYRYITQTEWNMNAQLNSMDILYEQHFVCVFRLTDLHFSVLKNTWPHRQCA